MREELAEQLLKLVLNWDIPTAKEEINKLRYLTAVKYDNYRNFEVGKRFLESLVLWLRQFKTPDERKIAYDFIIQRLLYISEPQMDHLVNLAYPQRIFPILLEQSTKILGVSSYQRKKIRTSKTYREIRRKSLFLGMSDGARMDAFRRKHNLNNEQVSVSYELSKDKCKRMYVDLQKWLNADKSDTPGNFENVFLIDDFSGSGNSILRFIEKDEFKGKLPRFVKKYLGTIEEPCSLGEFCRDEGPKLFILTYLATQKAITHLKKTTEKFIKSLPKPPKFVSCEIMEPLQLIEDKEKVQRPNSKIDKEFAGLLEQYYDDRIADDHFKTGGTDEKSKYSYAGCALPLVLCHNCPNNSVYLLWAEFKKTETHPGLKALFPRISRHLEGR